MNCEAYIELMSAALDGECTPDERRTLDAHLAVCPQCAALFDLLSVQTDALRGLDCTPPAGLTAHIMEHLPQQETPAKKGRILPWKRLAPVAAAACLVLVISLLPGLLPRGGNSDNSAPMEAADARQDNALYDGTQDAANAVADASGEASSYGNAATPPSDKAVIEEPDSYRVGAVSTIRVSYGITPEAPSAVVIGSTDALTEYLTDFGTPYNFPSDLATMAAGYGDDFFADNRLLCVVVEVESGSYTVEVADLRRDSVNIRIVTPSGGVGTCDMAAWLVVVEVDTMFEAGDTLSVEISR